MVALSKFQETAQRILNFPETFILDMGTYSSSQDDDVTKRRAHNCGTSYCAAGWLAYQDEYPEQYREDVAWYPLILFRHAEYSAALIGHEQFGLEWTFLFGDFWSDTFESLKKRAHYVLNHNAVPPKNQWYQYMRTQNKEVFEFNYMSQINRLYLGSE